MKKRILGIALAICMMIFCVPMGVLQQKLRPSAAEQAHRETRG